MTEKRKYDSTVARVAGNILAGMFNHPEFNPYSSPQFMALKAVEFARAVVAEVERTEPKAD